MSRERQSLRRSVAQHWGPLVALLGTSAAAVVAILALSGVTNGRIEQDCLRRRVGTHRIRHSARQPALEQRRLVPPRPRCRLGRLRWRTGPADHAGSARAEFGPRAAGFRAGTMPGCASLIALGS